MSARAIRWCLWLVSLATLPLPYFALARESAPALRASFLAGLFSAIWLAEGGGQAGLAAGMAAAQALGWLLALFLAAWLIARVLAARVDPRLRTRIVVLLCAGMIAAAARPIYDTPLSSSRPRANWTGIFD